MNGNSNGTNKTQDTRGLTVTDPSLNIDGRENIPDTDTPRLVKTVARDEHDQVIGELTVRQNPGETFVIHKTGSDGCTIATPATKEEVDSQRELEDMAHTGSSSVTTHEQYDNNTPLDQFNIKSLLGLDIMDNINISFTNINIFTVLSASLIIYVYVINNNFGKVIPNNASASSESIYHTVYGIVASQINEKKGLQFFPFIFVLFIFILINNLIGMVPYAFATTSHFAVTFSLSFTLVLGATILGFYLHTLKYFGILVPTGCPLALLFLLTLIEFISYLSRPVSLGLRLAANVLAGHMLLNILSGFTYKIFFSGSYKSLLFLLPFAFVIAFSGLEVGVAFIQAQVFAVLSSSYIRDGLEAH